MTYDKTKPDARDVLDVPRNPNAPPSTERQMDVLRSMKMYFESRPTVPEAHLLITKMLMHRKLRGATYRQMAVLWDWGMRTDVSFDTAKRLIDDCASNGWKPTKELLERWKRKPIPALKDSHVGGYEDVP